MIAASWGCGSTFIVGVDIGVGGIGQSFLDSNKFSDTDPALGHGVLAVVGVSSSGGDYYYYYSAEKPPWDGFLWSFPFSKFPIVMGMVSGVCVVALSALGVGMHLATTCTLYFLFGISFLLLSLDFVPLLSKGLVLGLVGLG